MSAFEAAVVAAIQRRMAHGGPFTFGELWRPHGDVAYRLADREIQRWRKRGWIAFTRTGRQTVWSVTDTGRCAINAGGEG